MCDQPIYILVFDDILYVEVNEAVHPPPFGWSDFTH